MNAPNPLELRAVTKSFGDTPVLRGIDLAVEPGEFTVFVGPSGCGKSTLLRIVAGLETASGGSVHIGGRRVDGVPPAERGIAMVFQSYALYPHLDVRGNMALGLKQAGTPRPEIERRISVAARMLELEPLLARRPTELSGGQRQRVAIGRAIVRDPVLFLFDEPLSNLDAGLRSAMRLEIARLHRTVDAAMVYVTHDQVEAMTLADRIAVMRDGRIEQHGEPLTLYNEPANLFVAGFLGMPALNVLPGETMGQGGRTIGLRPERLRVVDDGRLSGEIVLVERLGADTNLVVSTGSGEVTARLFGQHAHRAGERLGLDFDDRDVLVFDREGRRVVA